MSHPHFILYGQRTPPPAPIPLRAGPVQAWLDPTSGFLRNIGADGVEWVRGVYAAVRDANWNTVPGRLTWIHQDIQSDHFSLEFAVAHARDAIQFEWTGAVRGTPEGALDYTFSGRALSRFQRNRIGFCVLHPIRECAGARARQFRTNSVVDTSFPQWIEPQIFGQASFRDLKGLTYEIAPDVWVEIKFAGDIFEMEDQRNWTDASYKTYCTPLALPFPVWIEAGTEIQQRIQIRPAEAPTDWKGPDRKRMATSSDSDTSPAPTLSGKTVVQSVDALESSEEVIPLSLPTNPSWEAPSTGFCFPDSGRPHTLREVELIARLRPAHLRFDLHPHPVGGPPDPTRLSLVQALAEVKRMRTELELVLQLPEDEVQQANFLESTRDTLLDHPDQVARVLVYQQEKPASPPKALQRVRELFQGMNIPVGGGSDANFCELNREQALQQFDINATDFLVWSVNPQAHTQDHHSILETLEAQPDTLHSARQLAPHLPLGISPITLRQRFNPVATGPESAPSPDELPSQVDPRQLSLFTAAWTMASWMRLAQAGAAFLTYYETVGWKGLCERMEGCPLPDLFPSLPGKIFPVYQSFYELNGWPMGTPVAVPKGMAGCLLFKGQERRLLVVNLSDQTRHIQVHAPDLTELPHVFGEKYTDPVRVLSPYSILIQDFIADETK